MTTVYRVFSISKVQCIFKFFASGLPQVFKQLVFLKNTAPFINHKRLDYSKFHLRRKGGVYTSSVLKNPDILFSLGCTKNPAYIYIVKQQANLFLQVTSHFSTASILGRYKLERTSPEHTVYLTALSVPHEF